MPFNGDGSFAGGLPTLPSAATFTTGAPNGVLSGKQWSVVVDTATGIAYQNTDGAHAWVMFAPSGGSSKSTSGFTTGSPDGTVTGVVGQQLTDTATGVTWKNYDGGTTWDPIDIPRAWGSQLFIDFLSDANLIVFSAVGTATSSLNTSTAQQPGTYAMGATVAGTDGASLHGNTSGFLLGGGAFRSRQGVRLATLSDGTNNVIARVGTGDTLTFGDHVDGVYFEYDFGTYGDHNWRLCAANNSTRTKTDTGIAAVASAAALTTLQIDVNAAGTSVTGKINGVSVPTPVTTNIPTGAGRVFGPVTVLFLKSLGPTVRNFFGDWAEYWNVLSVKR